VNKGNLARWQNSAVEVRAELIPRCLYTTASVDVYVGDDCILRTGGVWRLWGTQSADFMHEGSGHSAELSWRSRSRAISYELKIDGQCVLNGLVRPRNSLAALIPAALAIPLVILLEKLIGR
jgi:hypothetical protein